MQVEKPIFKLVYEGKNITKDISDSLTQLTYTDKTSGESDDCNIEIADPDRLWMNEWYPTKGDIFSVEIGFEGQDLVPCGSFTVDSFEFSGAPNRVTLKGLATSNKKSLRTKNKRAFEGQTLRQIAQTTADNNDLTLIDGTAKTVTGGIDVKPEHDIFIREAANMRNFLQVNNTQGIINSCNILLETVPSLSRKGFADVGSMVQSHSFTIKGQCIYLQNHTNGGAEQINQGFGLTAGKIRTFAAILDDTAARVLISSKFKTTTSKLDNVRIDRATQNNETDLAFLFRVAKEYGFIFSVKGDKLIFIFQEDIETQVAITGFDFDDITSYTIVDQTQKTYKSATVRYHNKKKRELVEHTISATNAKPDVADAIEPNTTEDTLYIHTKTENTQQAEQKARAALYRHNSYQQEGDFGLPGNPYLMAGNNFQLTGFGQLSGTYHIESSAHSYQRGAGYTVNIRTKRIAFNPAKKNKPTPKRTASGEFNFIDRPRFM
jgi:phage protein D